MFAHGCGALGEDDAGFIAVIDHRHQNGRILELQRFEMGYDIGIEQEIAVLAPGVLHRAAGLAERPAAKIVG